MKDTTQVETIYRAKKIDSDEYVEGNYCSEFDGTTEDMIVKVGSPMFKYDAIDPSTRAIHFTNSGMNDSEGTPIFASLSSDGNGGDVIEDEVVLFSSLTNSVVIVEKPYIGQYDMYQGVYKPYFNSFKVTGIHTVKEES